MPSSGDAPECENGMGEVLAMGVGYGGLRILHELASQTAAQRLRLVGVDCDEEALESLAPDNRILLGQGLSCPRGCGGEVSQGERAAAAAAAELRAALRGVRLAIICVGLGGGTGTGSVVTIARHGRDMGVPTFFIATIPFAFEGSWRVSQAEAALGPLREHADAVVAVPNDALFARYQADLSAKEAFELADRLVADCVAGLAGMMWADRLLSADFGVVRAVLSRHRGPCRLASGKGSGQTRVKDAVDSFRQCPLVGDQSVLERVSDAVINLQATYDISIADVNACMTALQQTFGESTRVSIGVCKVDDGDADIHLTGILCQGRAREQPAVDEAARTPTSRAISRGPAVADKKRQPPGGKPFQEELPFQEFSLGVFANSSPTRHEGENLDIPTFQRAGTELDLG